MAQTLIDWVAVLGRELVIIHTDELGWIVNPEGTRTKALDPFQEEMILDHLRYDPDSGLWVMDMSAPFLAGHNQRYGERRNGGIRVRIFQPN